MIHLFTGSSVSVALNFVNRFALYQFSYKSDAILCGSL